MSVNLSVRWLRRPAAIRLGTETRSRSRGRLLRAKRLGLEHLECRAMMSAGGLDASIDPASLAVASENVATADVGQASAHVLAATAGGAKAKVAADAFETDDTRALAQTIGVNAGPQSHSIHVAKDVDWVTFELAAASDVVIETRGRSGDTRMWLYGSNPKAAAMEFDNNDGVGNFSVIVRSGNHALAAGTYYVKVDEAGQNAVISSYTVSVTSLQKGDVLLTQGKDVIAAGIRAGEALQLDVKYSNTFSHSAIYIGNGKVAEMLASGFEVTSLAKRYAESQRVDILRDRDIGDKGGAVVAAAMKYADTPYAFTQISVFATAVTFPNRPKLVVNSPTYKAYKAVDAGSQRMICSELVARAFDDAAIPIDVRMWPTLAKTGKSSSKQFRIDFTTPTMLAQSPDFKRLNA